jgi:ribonuclease HI
MGIRRAVLKTDSKVISGHIDKSCKARDPKLKKYLDTVRRIEASFEGFSVKNIPRGENEHADLLAKSAAQGLPLPSEVFFETIKAYKKTGELRSSLSFRVTFFQMTKLIRRG